MLAQKSAECANAIEKYAPANKSYTIYYQQWQSVDNQVEKVDITGTVDDCFNKLKTQVGPFLLHAYVKRKQAASFKLLVQKCDGKSVVFAGQFF